MKTAVIDLGRIFRLVLIQEGMIVIDVIHLGNEEEKDAEKPQNCDSNDENKPEKIEITYHKDRILC